jgi:hypothetical protein
LRRLEVALPGKLVREMIASFYRDNRFVHGTLQVGDRVVGPSTLAVPRKAPIEAQAVSASSHQ